jgi:beta-galactosidase
VRRHKIELVADTGGVPLLANGSDVVPVVAYMTDKFDRKKRLTEERIKFRVEGEGALIDDHDVGANPQQLSWGEAIVFVRASTTPGRISVKAEVLWQGTNTVLSATLEMQSVACSTPLLYDEQPKRQSITKALKTVEADETESLREKVEALQSELNELRLKEVERQQSDFENMPE